MARPDQRWEYQLLRTTPTDATAALAALGAEGWRVVQMTAADPGAVHVLLERAGSTTRPSD